MWEKGKKEERDNKKKLKKKIEEERSNRRKEKMEERRKKKGKCVKESHIEKRIIIKFQICLFTRDFNKETSYG